MAACRQGEAGQVTPSAPPRPSWRPHKVPRPRRMPAHPARQVPATYISGDNASLGVVRAIAATIGPVEIAILFAGAASAPTVPGAYMTLTSSQAAQAAQILGAARVLPVHCNSWKHLIEGARELDEAFTQAGIAGKLTLLEPGQGLTLRPPSRGFLGPCHASLR